MLLLTSVLNVMWLKQSFIHLKSRCSSDAACVFLLSISGIEPYSCSAGMWNDINCDRHLLDRLWALLLLKYQSSTVDAHADSYHTYTPGGACTTCDVGERHHADLMAGRKCLKILKRNCTQAQEDADAHQYWTIFIFILYFLFILAHSRKFCKIPPKKTLKLDFCWYDIP